MASEPAAFGFAKPKAAILSRIADREGIGPRSGSYSNYPQPIRGGHLWRLAALTEELAQGDSATARIIEHNGENFYWSTADEDTFEAYDFFMNLGETIATDTKIACLLFGTIWVVVFAYCEPSDTLPDETTGSEGDDTGGAGTGGSSPGGAVPGGADGGGGGGLGGVMLFGPDNFTEPGFLPQEAL